MRRLIQRLRYWTGQKRAERELAEEMELHRTMRQEAMERSGMPDKEAGQASRRAMGNVTAAREDARAIWIWPWFEHLIQDLRYACRILTRNPGFAIAVVLTLALAIGATTTIFSVVDAVLLQPLPFPEPDRIVTVWQTDPQNGNQPGDVAPANFLDWREQAQSYAHMASVEPWSFDFTGGEQPEVFLVSLVSEGFFETLGITAVHGRTFLPEEFEPGNRAVVVLTDGLWRRRFGADPALIGRSLTFDAQPYTVVGVLPPDFELGLASREREVFAPKIFAEYETRLRGSAWWHVIGRLRSDVTIAEAQAEMDGIAGRLAVDYPRTNADVGARVIPLHARQVGTVRPALFLLIGAVIFLLLIACVNAANLMLAQCSRRELEFAIRAALGGGRTRLLRQLMTESVVIAAVGALGGVILATYALELAVAFGPGDVPRLQNLTVDTRVFGFTVLLLVATAIGFGMAPALRTVRGRGQTSAIAHGRGGGATVGQRRLRRGLVATEVALAFVLLVGAGLLARSFARLVDVDLGFAAENMVALQVVAWDRHDGGTARANFFRQTLEEIRALPGVDAASAVSSFPLAMADFTAESPLTILNQPSAPPGEEPSTVVSVATPAYIETMRIPLRQGRWFDDRDVAGQPPVAVVNETLAERHWPNSDPVTARVSVQFQGQEIEAEIVGIVGGVRSRGFDTVPRPELFLPHAQQPHGEMTYLVRSTNDPMAVVPSVQSAIWAVDPFQAFYSVATVEQLLHDTLSTRRLATGILVLFGLVALLIATVGIYGVTAVATSQRRQEIGLRRALGAQTRDIVGMVVKGALGLALTGLIVGLLAALALSRYLSSLLFEVAPIDFVTFASVAVLLLIVAVAAAYIPARRALSVDPAATLRPE